MCLCKYKISVDFSDWQHNFLTSTPSAGKKIESIFLGHLNLKPVVKMENTEQTKAMESFPKPIMRKPRQRVSICEFMKYFGIFCW